MLIDDCSAGIGISGVLLQPHGLKNDVCQSKRKTLAELRQPSPGMDTSPGNGPSGSVAQQAPARHVEEERSSGCKPSSPPTLLHNSILFEMLEFPPQLFPAGPQDRFTEMNPSISYWVSNQSAPTRTSTSRRTTHDPRDSMQLPTHLLVTRNDTLD